MPAVLFGVGAALVILTFLLAFTVFGEISALLGVLCLVTGALMIARRSHGQGTD